MWDEEDGREQLQLQVAVVSKECTEGAQDDEGERER